MILNLNKLSFAGFGTILSDHSANHGFPVGEEWEEAVYTVEKATICVAEGPVYLDFEEGMTVLAVERDGTNHCFYLDKPVCVQAGVRFAVAPYQQRCSFRMCHRAGERPVPVAAFEPPEDFRVSRRLKVGNLYTMFYQEKEKGFFFKGEKHTVLELTYVDKGVLHSVVDGADSVLHQGDMMVYGAEQWHMQYADEDCAVSFITVSFDMEGGSLAELYNRKFTMAAQDVELLRQMLREMDEEDPYSGDMILCLLEQLLVRMLRMGKHTGNRLKTPAALRAENEIVSRAQRYVAEHVCERLSVGIVAKEVGVSTSHLTALFRKNLNIVPGEYIRRSKLEESKLMIKEGVLNFTQISSALSYSTVHHFSRQFKEKYGITPSEYAKAIK